MSSIFDKESIAVQMEIIEQMKISYVIGAHVENGIFVSYCLMRFLDEQPDNILLAKQSSSCLKKEVENLSKYFEATVLIEE